MLGPLKTARHYLPQCWQASKVSQSIFLKLPFSTAQCRAVPPHLPDTSLLKPCFHRFHSRGKRIHLRLTYPDVPTPNGHLANWGLIDTLLGTYTDFRLRYPHSGYIAPHVRARQSHSCSVLIPRNVERCAPRPAGLSNRGAAGSYSPSVRTIENYSYPQARISAFPRPSLTRTRARAERAQNSGAPVGHWGRGARLFRKAPKKHRRSGVSRFATPLFLGRQRLAAGASVRFARGVSKQHTPYSVGTSGAHWGTEDDSLNF